ncbi:uncharacterized protein LOC124945176 [Impatiens glandulifera]|uniref:uncharacterized protein LOC124945176 n=1 Tax=Impatiens glandulifera TaxID=253017 RepID=UPI001FB06231|nr:uncharacterized protein LOC124945176 [Impatiens glandulifera]
MGKSEQQQQLPPQLVHHGTRSVTFTFFRDSCLSVLSIIRREFNFKCLFILIFALAVLVSTIFWVVPLHSNHSGIDAINLSATVQARFVLEKPVSTLIPHIDILEYDINNEIGIIGTKVIVLSMNQRVSSNMTTVVFGFISDPPGFPISSVYLSVLRSSLVQLFLLESNLTLTTMFGKTSFFQILKFPWEITVIPETYVPFMVHPQILFNFTLNNSVDEIMQHLDDLKKQLKFGLRLRPYENVDAKITNINGSTISPPIIVQAAVKSDLGGLPPQRLKQLAQTIMGSSPAKNLGLNNTVFGKVKEISLSSYLNHSINATSPSPSPAPSPGQIGYGQTAPNRSPFAKSHSPAHSPQFKPHFPSCLKNCAPSPMHVPHLPSPSSPPSLSSPSPSPTPSPSPSPIHDYQPGPHCQFTTPPPKPAKVFHAVSPAPSVSQTHVQAPAPAPAVPTSRFSPNLSPLPSVVSSSSMSPKQGEYPETAPVFSPSYSPFPSSFPIAGGSPCYYYMEIWRCLSICGFLMFHLLCWSHR